MESNRAINETKSNTAIMASSIAWGVLPGAMFEGGLQLAYRNSKKKDPNSEITKSLHTSLYGTSDQMNFQEQLGDNKLSRGLEKARKSKAGSYLFNGSSTAKGRFMNYGVGGGLSVLSGAMAINKNNNGE